MDTLERLQVIREIEELSIDYWDDVDRNWGKNAHEYYTEDGSYTTSTKMRTGREAIKAFYDSHENRNEGIVISACAARRIFGRATCFDCC